MPRRALSFLAGCVLALALVPAATASERAPAIVGGSLAAPGGWPWAAAIGWVLPDGHVSPACTGSLVGERWVLTASHCARPAELLGLATIGEEVTFRIVIGETDIRTPPPESTYTADAGDVVAIPPPAGSVGTDLDLALIRLDRPAPEQAIRIPGAGQSAEAAALTVPGTPATVIGWGLESETSADISYDLRQVAVPIVADEDCRDAYPLFEGFGLSIGFDARTMVCAGLPEGGKDACAGDSGGPLMVPDGYGGWVQIGITSWGEGCARAGRPGIYARLAGLFGFVVTRTAADPEAPTAQPDAVTEGPSAVTRRRATLGGTVTPNGLATSYLIELGTSQRYRTGRVQGYAGAGPAPVAVQASFAGLKPGRTYHYRVTASNVAGVVRGDDETFTTRPAKKKAKTKPRR